MIAGVDGNDDWVHNNKLEIKMEQVLLRV